MNEGESEDNRMADSLLEWFYDEYGIDSKKYPGMSAATRLTMRNHRKKVEGSVQKKEEKDPLQIDDIRNNVLYTFRESTTEVDFIGNHGAPDGHPFARVNDK